MEIRFQIAGMTCAACSARVESVTKRINGVISAEVNLLAGTMRVQATEDVTSVIVQAVEKAGYSATVVGGKPTPKKDAPKDFGEKRRIVLSFVFLGILMYFTMGHMIGLPLPAWYHGTENAVTTALTQLFLTLPIVYLNRAYYMRGLKALRNGAANMDTLIAVGSGASLVYGVVVLFQMANALGHGDLKAVDGYSRNLYFESAAMILTLISLGKYLESRAKRKTTDAIRKLMELNPKTAIVKRAGKEMEIPAEQVAVGDVVIIRSGSRIPVDGVVTEGHGSVDQSALTGESVPVDVQNGSLVSAGTVNTEGYFEFRAERVGEDTTLAQVIRLVEEAGGSKAPIARLADKVAGVFVPIVMGIAVITFAVWLIAGQGVSFALNTAISVLVISCPCALGLATPVAIMVGTGRGASMGILFKDAESLERLHSIDTVVLDKTGTLTVGTPIVTDVLPVAADNELLLIAASLEQYSEHPFAKAIIEFAADLKLQAVEAFETLPGRGVCGIIHKRRCVGGNRQLMLENGIAVPDYHELAEKGKTPLYFAADGVFLGVIAASDVLKPDSALAVAQMKKLRLDVVMLTGDNKATANTIAENAGITFVIADVLPQEKTAHVEKLRSRGRKVLMVGDGINDAPSLITADVGMSVGSGTDIAIESADVIIANNSLQSVAEAISLSKATIRNIKQNLFWAFFYNILGIPIAAGVLYLPFGVLLSPMIGAAAMSFSSVFVVTNALRLRFFGRKQNEKDPIHEMKEESTMETVIKVEGMMCAHCKARVESVCKAIPGVADAEVDLQQKQVTVRGEASLDALKNAITEAGYEVIG